MKKGEQPPLYTSETIVHADRVTKADTRIPVNVLMDSAGNHALTDGNHRAYRALTNGNLNNLPRTVIGTIKGDVSQDPDFKPIANLKVVHK